VSVVIKVLPVSDNYFSERSIVSEPRYTAMQGSPTFNMYSRNLQRIFWAEFIDVQTQMTRNRDPRAVGPDAQPQEAESLGRTFEYHRQRNSSGS
jgi:hypothetical protein